MTTPALTPEQRAAALRAANNMGVAFRRVNHALRESGLLQAIERMKGIQADPAFAAYQRRHDRAAARSRAADTSRKRRPHGRR